MPDELAYKASLHEGAHCASAVMLGWPLEGASRSTGWDAETLVTPQTHGDIWERGVELAAITLSPFLLGYDGLADDLRIIADLAEKAVPIDKARKYAETFIHSARHWHLRNAVADALLKRPVLGAEELAEILEA